MFSHVLEWLKIEIMPEEEHHPTGEKVGKSEIVKQDNNHAMAMAPSRSVDGAENLESNDDFLSEKENCP